MNKSSPEQWSNVGVIDVGCGNDVDSRADTTLDINERVDPDIVHDIDQQPWPIKDDAAEGIVARHIIEHLEDPVSVIKEMTRIVMPDGWIEIRMPFGGGWFKDPTHRQFWMYSTPEYLADNPEFEWDYYFDLPLELENREFTRAWLMAPGVSKLSPLFRLAANRWPGDWVTITPWARGEITTKFRVTEETD